MSIHKEARQHFVRNAWEPIAIPRWALTTKYALFLVVGLLAFIIGVPTLDLTTFNGYESIWAFFVAVGALIALIGSLKPQYAASEAWGGLILLAFLSVLVVELCARGSITVAALLLVTFIVPLVRTGYLVTRWVYRYRRMEF